MLALLPPLKALADETRLRLLNVLLAHELNVNELVAILDMGQSRISRHLKILADSGLAQSRRDGLWVFYSAMQAGRGREFLKALAPLLRGPELERDLERANAVVEERSRATKRFFDAIAGDWDRRSREVLGDLDLAGEVVGRMEPCKVAADLGCGTGEMIEALQGKAASIIGVDNSPAMLEQAAKRFQGDGGKVSLRIGDLNHLPLRDGEADFALMSLALHHLVRPQDAVAEAGRILGPGRQVHDRGIHAPRGGGHALGTRRPLAGL